MFLFKSDITSHFQCVLRIDSELGPISIDLEVNPDLITKAFQKTIENISYDNQDDYYDYVEEEAAVECLPGKTCESDFSQQVRSI